MSRADLAKQIGAKGESYISELELGGIKKGGRLHQIADALGVSVKWLETGKGEQSPPDANGDEIAPSFARLLTAANIDQSKPVTQVAVARALGVSPQTVSAWRAGGVSKDGADFAEAKFGVPAAWILYGTGMRLVGVQSQPARLDADRLAMLIEAVESAAEGVWKGEARSRALLVAALYMDGQVTPETAAVAARAALNGVLSTHRGMRESTVKG